MNLVCLYHGTDLVSATALLNQGVNAAMAAAFNVSGEFWATTDSSVAEWFARSNPAGGTPAWFSFELPERTLQQLLQTDPAVVLQHTATDFEFFADQFCYAEPVHDQPSGHARALKAEVPMRHDPLFFVWDVRCTSPGDANNVRGLLYAQSRPDAVLVDTLQSAGKSWNEPHRVGDYFDAIEVRSGPQAPADTIRLVFCRSPKARRFWKDVMIRLLRSAQGAARDVTVTLAYRGDDASRLNQLSACPAPR